MFVISEEQHEKIAVWMRTLPDAKTGACGGRYTYSFTPTSIGCVLKVKDNVTQQEIDITDYDW